MMINHDIVLIKLVKTHPDAVIPTIAHAGDSCYDLYAVEDVIIPGSCPNLGTGCAKVPIGLQLAFLTPGFGLVIRGRSGLGFKHGLMPHFGEIDETYRGDLSVKIYNLTNEPYHVQKGDRIAQMKVEKVWPSLVVETQKIENTVRKDGGFGSTGR